MSALCSALWCVLCSLERLNKLFISSSVMWLNAAFPARQIYLTKCFLLNYLLASQRKLLFEGLFLFAIDWLLWETRSIGTANHLQLMIHRAVYILDQHLGDSSNRIGSCLYIICIRKQYQQLCIWTNSEGPVALKLSYFNFNLMDFYYVIYWF